MPYDTIFHNGTVVTVNAAFDVIPDGLVCVEGGVIRKVASRTAVATPPEARETIDAEKGLIMPGLVNSHVHLPMTLFRGLADDLVLQKWLEDYIFPAETRHLNPESVETATLVACAEMLLSGTTTCCDGYFLEHDVARAVERSGMRAVLGQGVVDFPAPGVPDPSRNIAHAVAFAERWREATPLITPSIFCHSPYTCAAKTLQKAKSAAERLGILFQIHAAETRDEAGRIETGGRTLLQHLEQLELLDARTLLVHAVWVNGSDIARIANRKTPVVHNPESNMKLGAGICPVPEMLRAGVNVGLGTDGCASNNDLDLFREMDTAAKLHKVRTLDPTVMDARSVLEMATIRGAGALGLGDRTGSLEEGKEADIVVVDTRRPGLTPLYNPVSQIVYAADGSDVRHVMVAGTLRVRDRRLVALDIEETMDRMTRLAESIKP